MAAAQTLELIKTLMATVEELRKEQQITSAQVTELYTMMTPRLDSLSSKLDMFDQKSAEQAPAKAVVKKRATAKKVVVEEDADEAEEPVKIPAKKKIVKKNAAAAVEEEPDAPVESDPEVVPAKPRGKKTPKAVASEAKPARDINIMQYFNQEYAKDPKTFNLYLTEAVKESIHSENADELDGLKGAELAKKKQALYYHYVKDNYNPQLQAMKKAYLASEKAKNIKLLDADEDN